MSENHQPCQAAVGLAKCRLRGAPVKIGRLGLGPGSRCLFTCLDLGLSKSSTTNEPRPSLTMRLHPENPPLTIICQMAAGQNQWYHFGVGAPPTFVYLSGDWDVNWGYDLDFDPWPNRGFMDVGQLFAHLHRHDCWT